jgi:hypothetical protein
MMATKAIHTLGDISRDAPSLAIIDGEDGDDFIGEWVTGVGYVNVRFPKATTRELTAEERAEYNGKLIDTAGAVRPIVISEPEPLQVDTSTLLDLVRQYAGARVFALAALHAKEPDVQQRHLADAEALFDRIAALVPQQPDPLVLSLPTVPEGAVALVGGQSGQRWTGHGVSNWMNVVGGAIAAIGIVLHREGSVTVEMAPPREPRTWPKLDGAPDGVRKVQVKRGNGPGFVVTRRRDNLWAEGIDRAPDTVDRDQCYCWGELLELGELVEVFDDEPGGDR